MDFKDYYQILGVDENVDAKTLKSSYRKLARKYHPDVSDEKEAEDRFKEVAEAYEVLKNKEKRAEYDALRQYGGAKGFEPPPNWQGRSHTAGHSSNTDTNYQGGFSDFFEEVFGQAQHGSAQGFSQQHFAQRGEDIELMLAVFLEDAHKGNSKTINYKVPAFDQLGRVSQQSKTLKVKIPAGDIEGERIRLKGQGAPGIGDAPAGDLYLQIKFAEHPRYSVDGATLTMILPVSPWEAALGGKFTVPTLDGKVNLSIPANSHNGKRLRLKGKGLGKALDRGDLFVVINIVIPEKATEQEQALWQQLSEQSKFDPRKNWGDT